MIDLQQEVVRAVCEKLTTTMASRKAGHCLQVPHLSRNLADRTCERLQGSLKSGDNACVIVLDPSRPWHATPTKAVELRNLAEAAGGQLVIFVPAGEQLAAEDSFGVSTFEVIETGDVYRRVTRTLLERIESQAPAVAARAEEIVRSVARRQSDGGERAAATYLATVLANPTNAELGSALPILGLVPDSKIADIPSEDVGVRLEKNRRVIDKLAEPGPVVERIRALPFDVESTDGQQMAGQLLEAISDGTTNRMELAGKLSKIDFDDLPQQGEAVTLEALEIIDLVGDFKEEGERVIAKDPASIGIKYLCRPPGAQVDGLKQLDLELLRVGESADELTETGVVAIKRRSQLGNQTHGQWKLKASDLDEGLYRFRIRARDSDGVVIREHLSETFKRGSDLPSEEAVEVVGSIQSATMRALALGSRPGRATVAPALETETKSKAHSLRLRFEGVRGVWQLDIPRALARYEQELLEDPAFVGTFVVSLATDQEELHPSDVAIPPELLAARAKVFEAIRDRQIEATSETGTAALVELADLTGVRGLAAAYLKAWLASLEATRNPALLEALLSIDQVRLVDVAGAQDVRILGPTHPLRLAWLVSSQEQIDRWSRSQDVDMRELRLFTETARLSNVPHLLPGERSALRHAEPLNAFWAIWLEPHQSDKGAVISQGRSWLGLERMPAAAIDVADLLLRVRRYLAAHPYIDQLVLNFVQPGAGKVVLDLLIRLQMDPDTARLRYLVRLFTAGLSRTDLGRALDDFMADPEGARGYDRDAVDAFLAAQDNPLTPKLTYSKHEVRQLVEQPTGYPAHLTFFLDWFKLAVVPGPRLTEGRSFFVNNLIVEPAARYSVGDSGSSPAWDEQVVIGLPSRDEPLREAYGVVEAAVARTLPGSGPGQLPVVRLELDLVQRSILDAVHRASDWVVFIDPVFTDAYLDSPAQQGEVPRYLVDYVEPGFLESSRRVMVSTRSRAELLNLFRPVLNQYSLKLSDDRVEALVDGLQLLGAGLPLKLLNNRTQALEALSLALGSIYLQEQGLLRRALAIPLDLHQDLFREVAASGDGADTDLKRTDLLVLQMDPASRRFGVNIVEVKARGALGSGIPQELADHINAQLSNSARVLARTLFGLEVRADPDSLGAHLQARRLYRILNRYAERARRYGILTDEAWDMARDFIESLEHPYSVAFEKHAILFDLEGSSRLAERVGDIVFRRIGRSDIEDMLARARTRRPTAPVVGAPKSESTIEVELDATMDALASDEAMAVAGQPTTAEALAEPEQGTDRPEAEKDHEVPTSTDLAEVLSLVEGPKPESVLLIGGPTSSRQFGIVGEQVGPGHKVAFDLDSASVVSLFGIQGSGKSYTVGTLLEAALIQDPALNRLPNPLGAVVFHYSQDMTYAPEFAAMASPNTDPDALLRLQKEYGTVGAAVPEVVVVVPAGVLGERQRDSPNLPVLPLLLAPAELTASDWQMLMGLKSGDPMYFRVVTQLIRQERQEHAELSVGSLKRAIERSSLSQQQRNLALTRLNFVADFVGDAGGISQHVKPGRLTIVDLRDELIQEDDALSLFMVLLNRFAQVETPDGRQFNKLIVFDEAHKYMRNPRLTESIQTAIREMRHKGTTVVIASQDPPSLPPEIISLSQVVVAHKFNSLQWLDHLGRALEPFGNKWIRISQLVGLLPGEAYVWSTNGAPVFQKPQKVRIRPRLSQHGGATRRATS